MLKHFFPFKCNLNVFSLLKPEFQTILSTIVRSGLGWLSLNCFHKWVLCFHAVDNGSAVFNNSNNASFKGCLDGLFKFFFLLLPHFDFIIHHSCLYLYRSPLSARRLDYFMLPSIFFKTVWEAGVIPSRMNS